MSRPTILDAELADRLVQAVVRLPITLAAAKVGVGRRTVYDWLARGETGEEPYATLTTRIAAARAEFAELRLREIESAGSQARNSGWKASAWYLERCWPDLFGARKTIEHTGPAGGAVPIRVEVLDDDQLRQLDELLARLEAADRPDDHAPGGPGRALPSELE